MVQVNPTSSTFNVVANSINSTNSVVAGQPASYYALISRDWAVSSTIVQNTDYSSKYYAAKSKEYADSILTDAGFIAVSEDLTNIDLVVGSISNVNAVATDISNVNAVYADLSNIDSVAGDLTNIDSAVSNATNINAVVANASNINTVASNIANVNAVAGSISNVNSVANDLTKINSVSDHLHYIEEVVDNISSVNLVSQNIFDVVSCANNISSISDCANNMNRLSACADNMTDVLTVADDISDVRTCSTNISDINTCADNIAVITNKANISLDNLSSTGKALMANSAMPSATKTSLVIGSSGSAYTAPANGYFNINCEMYGANTYIWLQIGTYKVFQWCSSNAQEAGLSIPAKKGDVCYLYYNCNPYIDSFNTGFNFYYAQGEA